jgi:hypothetical protein
LLVVAAAGRPVGARSVRFAVRQISLKVRHERDGKKHPNEVTETYALDKNGVLQYFAYFGGMPTQLNHTDSLEWRSGEPGKRALDIAEQLSNDPTSGLRPSRGSSDAEEGLLVVQLTRNHADVTRVLDSHSKGWQELSGAFEAMITAFERATHRPLKPDQLPQDHTPPPRRQQCPPGAPVGSPLCQPDRAPPQKRPPCAAGDPLCQP